MNVLIPKNSTIVCKKTKIFSTYTDYQKSALIKLYEGGKELVKDNIFIGSIRIDNITPLTRCQPLLEIKIDMIMIIILDLLYLIKLKEKRFKIQS